MQEKLHGTYSITQVQKNGTVRVFCDLECYIELNYNIRKINP